MIPSLNPNNLVVFYLVAEEKSMSAAAEKLCLTQPAVTYRLKSLEESVGVKLLKFKKPGRLSTARIYHYAEAIYQSLNAESLIQSIKERRPPRPTPPTPPPPPPPPSPPPPPPPTPPHGPPGVRPPQHVHLHRKPGHQKMFREHP
jgi:hypothetical protein